MSRVIAILALLLCAAHAQARTLYVSLTGSHDTNAPAFSTWATAATNIQAAIDAASDGDTVRVGPGTYYASDAQTNAVATLTTGIILQGGKGSLFDADATILDAQLLSGRYVVDIINGTGAVISGITVTGGSSPETVSGGGIRVVAPATSVLVENCVVRGNVCNRNVTYSGAGIYIPSTSVVTALNSIVVGNASVNSSGSAIDVATGGSLTLINCISECNESIQVSRAAGTLSIINSIYGNTSGTITDLGGNLTSNTTNSVMRALDIAPASDGVGTNLQWAGVSAYIPRLGSLARKNGQPYAGIETASDGAGGPALTTIRPFLGRDATTNLNHGAAIGGVTSVADSPFAGESSAAFDGTVQYLLIGDANPLRLAGAMTIEAWIRTDAVVPPLAVHRIYNKCGPPGARGSSAMIMTNNIFRFDIATSASAVSIYTNTAGVPTNEWIHVAAAYSPSTSVILFTNGTISAAYTSGIPAAQYNSNGVSAVLGTMLSSTNNNGYKGNLSDVRIWNVARTPEQIAANYTNRLTGTEEGLVGYWPLKDPAINLTDTGPFNLDNPIIHPTYMEAF